VKARTVYSGAPDQLISYNATCNVTKNSTKRMVKLSSAKDIPESTGLNSHVICASIALSQFSFLSLNYVVLRL